MQSPDSTHERRVTWALMGVVVGFVLLMTGIVIWITASLIRQELGRTSGSSPDDSGGFTTPILTAISTITLDEAASATRIAPTNSRAPTEGQPAVAEATWTPVKKARYVRFVYWKVRPNRIKPGECVQITWETEYAIRLKFYRDGDLFLDDAPAKTTVQDCPTKKSGYIVYRLVAWNAAEESNWIQLQVKVDEAE